MPTVSVLASMTGRGGAGRNATASPTPQKPPLKWSDDREHPVEDAGSRPRAWLADRGRRQDFPGDRRARAEAQSVLCYDRKTGKLLWQNEVHRGGVRQEAATPRAPSPPPPWPATASASSSTSSTTKPSTPPPSICDGKQLWQTKISRLHAASGFRDLSPAVYRIAGDRVGRQQGRRRDCRPRSGHRQNRLEAGTAQDCPTMPRRSS